MKHGRDLLRTMRRMRELSHLDTLVTAGKERLSCWLTYLTSKGALRANIKTESLYKGTVKLVFTIHDDPVFEISEGGVRRLRDFLNTHFPPPEKKAPMP